MKKLTLILIGFLFAINLFASPSFPELTGRVVDKAGILSTQEERELSLILQQHEQSSSNQIVIVTLNSLNGYEIADYGYQLARHWKLGQKDKNNGILLIISMQEKKLRIEVGYGLEGVLTDKTAHEIIEYVLKPKFRQGSFYNGITDATNSIIKAINGEYTPSNKSNSSQNPDIWFFIFFGIIFISVILGSFTRKLKNQKVSKFFHSNMLGGFTGTFAIGFTQNLLIATIAFFVTAIIVFITTKKVNYSNNDSSSHWGSSSSGGFGRYSSGGSFGSGGFSGGGGSFGGGGASGGW
jgi:uncharacterized protein